MRCFLLADVVNDPDRPFGGVIRVNEFAGHVSPEQFAIVAFHLDLGLVSQPLGHHRVSGFAQGMKRSVIRE